MPVFGEYRVASIHKTIMESPGSSKST